MSELPAMSQPEAAQFRDDVFKDERKKTYLNPEGADRPLKSPLSPDILQRARLHRIGRIREQLRKRNYDGLLLYDPVNIRYALDSSNMAIWTMHNSTRYALILTDGPAVMFEFAGCEHLNAGLPGVDEVRNSISWIYFTSGDRLEGNVARWADEIADLLRAGQGKRRLAADKVEPLGVFALQQRGVEVLEGQEVTEHARCIKSKDELALMRWTIRVCEAGMARMYEMSEPGRTEQEIWAELHFENARSGGEWLETKLLSAGARTNPWYSECSDYVIQRGDMISFDTDMVGPYGYCADLSRSWTCGHIRMGNKQRELYAAARDQIEHNLALLKPGLDFRDFNAMSWQIPERYLPYRYTCAVHGTGMADEWPVVWLHPDFATNPSGRFEENMVVNVESLIAEEGSESIKLETQVLITAHGAERLDTFPWEDQ
ncbi:Xaa-Pro peptidase family protein [Mesorhizobium sp.]|uniref:M24 family metallopeptidase n=1 Tax=Mesorhizobium sp. TaxID=1871066 RepID=UPI0025F6DB3C|nr:Xaa-Pro peptidase family protein [Mesorhizobium sp.]